MGSVTLKLVIDRRAIGDDSADEGRRLLVLRMRLIRLEGRVVIVFGDERDIPMGIDEAKVWFDNDGVQTGHGADEGLEAAPHAFNVLRSLPGVRRGEREYNDVADH